MTRRRLTTGFIALLGVVGVLLIPTASDAAPRRTRPPATATTLPRVVADLLPTFQPVQTSDLAPAAVAPAADARIDIPFIDLSFLNNLFANLGAFLQAILGPVFDLLCSLLGGFFCSS